MSWDELQRGIKAFVFAPPQGWPTALLQFAFGVVALALFFSTGGVIALAGLPTFFFLGLAELLPTEDGRVSGSIRFGAVGMFILQFALFSWFVW